MPQTTHRLLQWALGSSPACLSASSLQYAICSEFADAISGMSSLIYKRSSTARSPPIFFRKKQVILHPRSDSSFKLESCVEHNRCLSYRLPISESFTSSVLDSPKLRLHFLGRLREFLSYLQQLGVRDTWESGVPICCDTGDRQTVWWWQTVVTVRHSHRILAPSTPTRFHHHRKPCFSALD